ncbi:MAG: hypothetical protein ABFS86_01525 [Planctomycetota bacterium]
MKFDRKFAGWLMLVLICALLTPVAAFAQEETKAKAGAEAEEDGEGEDLDRVIVEVEAAVYSKYVWRGLVMVDDGVLQANVDIMWRGFTFTGWGNVDLTDENDKKGEFSELDVIVDYEIDAGPLDLHVGAIGYFFPDAGGDTTELYVSAGLDVLLSPTLTIYRDIDEVDGWYLSLSGSYSFGGLFQLTEKVGLSPELTASVGWADSGYNSDYYRHGDNGLADLTVGFVVPWSVLDTATVFAGAWASMLLDRTARDRSRNADNFWIGIGGSLKF